MNPSETTRRRFLQSLAAGAAGLAGCKGTASMQDSMNPGRKKRPNLVYVFADQLRHDCLGYGGDRTARTPNIDRLAAEGVNFRNAVTVAPVCAAHRASLLTGKYPSTTGMVINELRLNPHQKCFAHVLGGQGYETGYIGKWHLYANQAGHHDDPRNSHIPPGPHRLGFDGFFAAYNFHHVYYDAYYHRDSPEKIPYGEGVYEPDAQAEMAVDFIREHAGGGRPFALFVSFGTPHDPWDPGNVPKAYYDLFRDAEFSLPETWSDTPDQYMDRCTDPKRWLDYWKPNLPAFMRVYAAMNANLDRNVGRILQALDRAGVADDTVFVFTSDHGEMFGAQGRVFKTIFYEEACRVPFLLRWPGGAEARLVSDVCLNTPDIMPTLLSLMGLPVPKDLEGMDLSHAARGRPGPEPMAAFLQGMGHTYQWKDGFEWRALRDRRYTYAVYRVDGSELLFDNQEDPLQKRNLARDPAHAPELERFREMLKDKSTELKDSFEKCTWYRDHWTKDRVIVKK